MVVLSSVQFSILGSSHARANLVSTFFTVSYLIFSYEGTGRSLSLKLIQQLRTQCATMGSNTKEALKAANMDSNTKSATGWFTGMPDTLDRNFSLHCTKLNLSPGNLLCC